MVYPLVLPVDFLHHIPVSSRQAQKQALPSIRLNPIMVASKLQSNRPSQQSAFPNDYTNKSTLDEDRRKQKAIAAAKLQEAQAAEALALKMNNLEFQVKSLQETIKGLQETKAEAERVRDEWITKYNITNTAAEERIRQLTHDLEEQRKQTLSQMMDIKELKSERSSLDHQIVYELPNEDVQILLLAYGNQIYYGSGTPDHLGVLPKYKSAARDGNSFHVPGYLIDWDISAFMPNGARKTLTILYRYNRPGTNRRIRTLIAETSCEVRFDPWD
ncbi:hypothetical protein PEBR_00809 [Penicillium brasilianum]|uniref:Uncharacterized protein n=1 Tax=Penicillium brasilianum TaxID=104259 RepID=A0A1S9S1R7_PENBI|nr:hypothetical protein PEBR_00809 [Penicillium brasilianum]